MHANLFGLEVGVAAGPEFGDGHQHIVVQPVGQPQRLRPGGPGHRALAEGVAQAHAGLRVDAGEFVVFDTRAQRQRGVLAQPDLVVDEEVGAAHLALGRGEQDQRGVGLLVPADAIAGAPHQRVPLAPGEAVLELDVVGVALFAKAALLHALGVVPVQLQRQLRLRAKKPLPARQQVVAVLVVVAALRVEVGVVKLEFAGVGVALQRVAVAAALPVGAKAALYALDGVMRVAAVHAHLAVALPGLGIGPPVARRPGAAAVAQAGETLLLDAAADIGRGPLTVGRGSGDDVDNAVDGIRAPQRRRRAANDLDALQVRHEDVLRVPEHAREQRRIHAAAVDQHLHLVGHDAIEAAGRNRPALAVHAGHVQPRHQPQGLGDRARAAVLDLLGAEHKHRRRNLRQTLRSLGNRGHLDVQQSLQAQRGQVLGQLPHGLHAQRDAGEQDEGRQGMAGAHRNLRAACARPRLPRALRRVQYNPPSVKNL